MLCLYSGDPPLLILKKFGNNQVVCLSPHITSSFIAGSQVPKVFAAYCGVAESSICFILRVASDSVTNLEVCKVLSWLNEQ